VSSLGRPATPPSVHPIVGGLYRVETALLSGRDPKPKRPATVIALPAYGLDDVPLITRTSDLDEPGIAHPRNVPLGCTKDGVFGHRFVRHLDIRYFRVPAVAEYLGMLESSTFQAILEWWEKR
jgi:hypothetical protein